MLEKPQIIAHVQKSVNFTLFDAKWLPCSAKFVVLGNHPRGTGAIQIYELDETDAKLLHESEKPKSFKCGTFGASSIQQRHFATGDFEGGLQTWDLESLSRPLFSAPKAHSEIINAIDGVGGLVGEGAPEIVTGSRDGSVKVWDVRQADPVAVMEPGEGAERRDCWSVGFGHAYNPQDRCVAAGYDNGDVKLYDLRTMTLRWEKNLGNGVCCVEFDRKDIQMNKLAVTTLEAKFHVFDLRTQHKEKGFAQLTEKAHKSTIWLARHLPQNRDIFVTTGGCGGVNVWKYNYPSKRSEKDSEGVEMGMPGTVSLLQSTIVATQPISSLDAHPDKLGLCVCTAFDQTLRVIIITKLQLA